jgi:hypothetical protein
MEIVAEDVDPEPPEAPEPRAPAPTVIADIYAEYPELAKFETPLFRILSRPSGNRCSAAEAERYIAETLGSYHGSPDELDDLLRLLNYQRVALMLLGEAIRDVIRPIPFESLRAFIEHCRQ